MKDRGNDFLDCFKLEVGWGLPADAEVHVTDYISTGAGLAVGMKWGFDGRELVGFASTMRSLDVHVGLPFTPFAWWLFPSLTKHWDKDGSIRFWYTDLYLVDSVLIRPDYAGMEGVPRGLCWICCRKSHKSLLLFNLTPFKRYADREVYLSGGKEGTRRKTRRPIIDAFDIEVGASLGLSARVGFSPGQFLDFLLGWFGPDIGDDDTEPQSAPQSDMSEAEARQEAWQLLQWYKAMTRDYDK
jgi:hypothetical protein